MLYKNSKQRDMILECLKSSDIHMSAEQIFDTINKDDIKISLATVYRNLLILEDMQVIKKVTLPSEGYVYDKTCKLHYHFYCENCRKLYDIDMPYQDQFNMLVRNDTHVGHVDSHEITFKGVCKNCQIKEEIV